MKVPLSWLKEYVNFSIRPEDLAEKLTMTGTEVGAIEYHGAGIENVVVGKIKAVDALDDHLICEIDLGTKMIKIITDDLGLQIGDRVPVATDQSKLAAGVKIKKISLRGVESFGMLCRPHELGLAPAEQVLKLPLDAKIGTDVRKVIGKGGVIFDLEVLPNRADLQSIIGAARETAAVLNLKLRIPAVKLKEMGKKNSAKVEVRERKLCPRYMCRVIENVKVKESPQWMKEKLLLAGLRPVNNVVDSTNYVLLEYGQPLHAFDRMKVAKIIVRKAEDSEKIVTIDGIERKLNHSMLVIADQDKPIAVAGIMGGAETMVEPATTEVLLESAFFSPQSINQTSQMLKLKSESSVRFGKGVDWDGVEIALDRAAALIAELGEGAVQKGKLDLVSRDQKPKQIVLRVKRVNQVLGTKLSSVEIARILKRLGIKVKKSSGGALTLLIPGFRAHDLEREIDLIEEVARIFGYDRIPASISQIPHEINVNSFESFCRKVKQIMLGAGLNESQTFTILDPGFTDRLNLTDPLLKDYISIVNPLTEEESVLRTIMLPSLLKVVDHNHRHQVDEVKIFEIGKVYHKGSPVKEPNMLAGALCGKGIDFLSLKGVVSTLLSEFGSWGVKSIHENKLLHPGRSAGIIFENKLIGWMGELSLDIAGKYGFDQEVFVFEIDIELLLNASKPEKKFFALPRYPKTDRDVAMFINDTTTHSAIVETIRESGGGLVEKVELFDIYKNSRAYRITYRDRSRTLTVDEVNLLHDKITRILADRLKVELRK